MVSYDKKKKHIYAYRRRKTAKSCIEKLVEISKKMNEKDLGTLRERVHDLLLDMEIKLGYFDDVPGGGEIWKLSDERKNEEVPAFVHPVARYICPVCRKPGYLFSPNLDPEVDKLDRYILHISVSKESNRLCKITPLKSPLILISTVPSEGIITVN